MKEILGGSDPGSGGSMSSFLTIGLGRFLERLLDGRQKMDSGYEGPFPQTCLLTGTEVETGFSTRYSIAQNTKIDP